MIEIVGVRFRECGRVYFFKSGKFNLKRGDYCWLETERGEKMAEVVMATTKVYPNTIPEEMDKVLRPANPGEVAGTEADEEREERAFEICMRQIKAHELPMKLVKCRYIEGGKRIVFFFTADSRVDFRALIKDLAREFKTRIELRQIGVRDEAKILCGFGTCGRSLCCSSWLPHFIPISIKMAKQQNLSLNPQKISGLCGRLLCCLAYEVDFDGKFEDGKKKVDFVAPPCRPYSPPL
ncbi:MAG TPA: regulatory iron-sulfur-containing complex subunit RicT [Acidobacteriota bacterium]|nr:regulatory iron-sulfur-containing complex subunit RicT [Acidobacteriota bacterium]